MNCIDICQRAIAGKPRNQFVPMVGEERGRTPALVTLPAMVIRGLLAVAPTTDLQAHLLKTTQGFRDTEELVFSVDDIAAVLETVTRETPTT